jgi:hypothetical protein
LKGALPYLLVVTLVAHAGVHVAIAVGLARRRAFARAALALFVPPLAPWWAWQAGMRARTYGWAATLSLYAIEVAIA